MAPGSGDKPNRGDIGVQGVPDREVGCPSNGRGGQDQRRPAAADGLACQGTCTRGVAEGDQAILDRESKEGNSKAEHLERFGNLRSFTRFVAKLVAKSHPIKQIVVSDGSACRNACW